MGYIMKKDLLVAQDRDLSHWQGA